MELTESIEGRFVFPGGMGDFIRLDDSNKTSDSHMKASPQTNPHWYPICLCSSTARLPLTRTLLPQRVHFRNNLTPHSTPEAKLDGSYLQKFGGDRGRHAGKAHETFD